MPPPLLPNQRYDSVYWCQIHLLQYKNRRFICHEHMVFVINPCRKTHTVLPAVCFFRINIHNVLKRFWVVSKLPTYLIMSDEMDLSISPSLSLSLYISLPPLSVFMSVCLSPPRPPPLFGNVRQNDLSISPSLSLPLLSLSHTYYSDFRSSGDNSNTTSWLVSGWLTRCKCSGQGSTRGHDRVKDRLSVVVSQHLCTLVRAHLAFVFTASTRDMLALKSHVHLRKREGLRAW